MNIRRVMACGALKEMHVGSSLVPMIVVPPLAATSSRGDGPDQRGRDRQWDLWASLQSALQEDGPRHRRQGETLALRPRRALLGFSRLRRVLLTL